MKFKNVYNEKTDATGTTYGHGLREFFGQNDGNTLQTIKIGRYKKVRKSGRKSQIIQTKSAKNKADFGHVGEMHKTDKKDLMLFVQINDFATCGRKIAKNG